MLGPTLRFWSCSKKPVVREDIGCARSGGAQCWSSERSNINIATSNSRLKWDEMVMAADIIA
jgi:hypothetical protein